MSYFANTLKELLKRNNMNARRLSALSGVSQPTISRFINGEQATLAPDDMKSIAKSVSEKQEEQAELIMAHLLDERQGPGSELIDIRIKGRGDQLKESSAVYGIKLSKESERIFEILRGGFLSDKNVQEVLTGIANLISEGDATATVIEHKPQRGTRTRKSSSPLTPEQQS